MWKIITLILLYFFFSINIFSAEDNKFLSLKNKKVNVRYGPSFNYPIKFIYKKKFLPVKIIDKKENFRRIIDHKKNSGWIHISQLKKANSLVVLKDEILFKKPTKYSEPLIILQKGRLLIVKKCNINWCRITTDIYTGWIQTKNVWGAFK